MDRHLADRLAIRDVVETWVIARHSGDWETFRSTWHDDGYMMATWWQGPAEEFTEVSRAGWERGVNIMHFLGGCRVTVAGDRAIAQTKMTIMQRGVVHGVRCDVVCTARFYDFFERRHQPGDRRGAQPADRPGGESGENRWAIVLRQPIYEKDRLDPVDPAATVTLDPDLLNAFPEGYRHLAYLQIHLGFAVKPDMPGLRGPEVQRLYARGAAWLDGEPVARPAGPAGTELGEAPGAPEPVRAAGIAVTAKAAAMTEPTSPPGVPGGFSITDGPPTTTTSAPDAPDHARPVTP